MSGKFITFEGVEGCGKSTQMELLSSYLADAGLPVVTTREPGGNSVGESIREILLDPSSSITPEAEALLYAASRAQLVHSVIVPVLGEGKYVLCDRYLDSSLAYQGEARGLGMDWILKVSLWATRGLLPDLTFLLTVPVEKGLARTSAKADRIEMESIEFHRKVESGFLKAAEMFPERIVVIDGDREPDQVHRDILRFLKNRMGI